MPQVKCPQCNHEFNVAISAKVGGDNRFVMTLTMEEGRFLRAETLGGSISVMGELMEASAKSMGTEVVTIVEKIDVDGNKINIHYLIAQK